jgi:hypothetical protein
MTTARSLPTRHWPLQAPKTEYSWRLAHHDPKRAGFGVIQVDGALSGACPFGHPLGAAEACTAAATAGATVVSKTLGTM